MSPEPSNSIARHVAGATVSHAGPFASLEVPQLTEPFSQAFIDKWVMPFYRASLFGDTSDFAEALRPIAHEVTPELITLLLSDFNWRPRITAAFFAAIYVEQTVEDHIGKLLLRSDVCYAGTGYCLALARFNTEKSIELLSKYLAYYLTQPKLHFNQGEAIGALAYIDQINGTKHLDDFAKLWDQFAETRTYLSRKEEWIDRFKIQLDAIKLIAAEIDR